MYDEKDIPHKDIDYSIGREDLEQQQQDELEDIEEEILEQRTRVNKVGRPPSVLTEEEKTIRHRGYCASSRKKLREQQNVERYIQTLDSNNKQNKDRLKRMKYLADRDGEPSDGTDTHSNF